MRKILLIFSFVLVATQLLAQDRTVTGKITSTEDGSPIPGVTVVLKGTGVGVVSDVDGEYNITVPSSGGTLVFSFIGFETIEELIGEQAVVNVSLGEDVTSLSEIIVTAQGIEKTKNELSYAAQSVSGESLSEARDNNLMNSLSGKVSGVQIQKNNSMGGSTNVIIRGFKSLTGNNQALFVIDGVPIDNTTHNAGGVNNGYAGVDYGNVGADINPDDIESTTILKGPAATALYGSRAANGVVMITTKKGRRNGIGVTINTGVTMSTIDKSTMPKYQNQYGGGYGKYYGPTEDGYFDMADVDGDGILDPIVPTYEDASVGGPFDPNLLVYQWNAFGDPTSPNYLKKTPWVAAPSDPSDYFKTGYVYSNSIVIDGGSDKGQFKLGYTRTDETGVQPNSSLNKNFLNFSASYEVAKNLTASAAINFTEQDAIGRYATGYGGNNNLSSFRQWYQVNVDINELREAYERTGENITWNWSSGLPNETGLIYWDNPFFAANQNFVSDNRLRYLGYVKLDYKITDWLNVMGRVSLDSYSQLQEERTAVGSINYQPGEYLRRNISFSEYNYDLLATVNKELSDDFKLTGALGSNVRKTSISGISAVTNGGLTVPGIYALSNSLSMIEAPLESYSDKQVNGYFADAELGYQDYLFLTGAFRRDVSSTLPDGENAYNYFRVSSGFVFSKFIPQNDFFTYGKLRINYGEVGNDAPFNSLADLYDKPTGFGSVPLFSMPSTKNNSNLKPERTKSYEIGTELTFFDARLSLDVNYFHSSTINQILPVTVSTATGYSSKYVNAGSVENKGWEVTVGARAIDATNFKWDINLNWTRIRNEVTELYGDVTNLPLGNFRAGGGSLNAPLGGVYGTIYGYDYVYTNGQKTVLPNGRYQRSTTASNPIGNINPDWTGGIQNTFSYKSIALSFLLDMKQGGDVYSADMYYGLATGLYAETVGTNELGNPIRLPISEGGGILKEGVQADGSPNTVRLAMDAYPMDGGTVNPTAAYVYDASYIKLRELLISYSIPPRIIENWKAIKTLKFSAVGRNLWIIHKNLPYADPEDNLGAGNNQGYQVGSLPAVRNIGFNIKATF